MAAVRVPDVLLRVSPKMLERYNALAVAGAGRGRVTPLPYTFTRADASTCATYINRDGLVRLAAANVLRADDWAPFYEQGLVDANGVGLHGKRLGGARTNVVLHNRDLTNAAWVKTNVTAAKDQTGVDGVASSASKITATAANGTCLQAITLASSARFQSAYVKRVTGSGTINMTLDNGATWTVITVTAAWTRVTVPTQTLADPTVGFRIVTSGDAIAVDYVQNENGVFQSSVIPTTTVAVTRAADSLTLPFNFGPMDLTVLARLARPVHADASGTLGSFPGVWELGSAAPKMRVRYSSTAREVGTVIQHTANSFIAVGLPAGAEQTYSAQYKTLTAGGQTAIDVGSGLSAFAAAATPFNAFGDQTLQVGLANGEALYGVLLDLIVARNLHSLAEMEAVL